VTNGRAGRQDPDELGGEGPIDDDDGIGCAIDDIFEVRVEQAGIERVADGAEAHDPIPAFEVPAAVHGHGGNAIARRDAERLECRGEAPGAYLDSVGCPIQRSIRPPADDLAILSFPKIPSGLDSDREAESLHH
jgi:hypothetical protein